MSRQAIEDLIAEPLPAGRPPWDLILLETAGDGDGFMSEAASSYS
ncbi:hypothetical protein [Wenjunlia tyrosinilytica]|nr:hypothetical protein [Wenjunlia tyrosinilytica]